MLSFKLLFYSFSRVFITRFSMNVLNLWFNFGSSSKLLLEILLTLSHIHTGNHNKIHHKSKATVINKQTA